MNFFKFWKKNNDDSRNVVAPVPESAESQSPAGPVFPNNRVCLSTGFPIDELYRFMATSYEQEGYSDAFANADSWFRTSKENEIIRNFQNCIEQVRMAYDRKIKEIIVELNNAKSLFADYMVAALNARLESLNVHLSKIDEMESKIFSADEDEAFPMIQTYRRGFARGIAARQQSVLAV